MLPNTDAVNFCDIFSRHRAMFSTCPNKKCLKSAKMHKIMFPEKVIFIIKKYMFPLFLRLPDKSF